MRLRSVELELPDPAAANAFMTGPWGALPLPARDGTRYVRGSAAAPYLVALHPAPTPALRSVTFECEADRLNTIARAAAADGLGVAEATSDDPGGGAGIVVALPDGERFRFLAGGRLSAPTEGPDAPVKLTHVVLNAVDAERLGDLAERVFGFRVSDRTKGMVFVRCNAAHHSIAFARAGYSSLNHIAFEMADLDAVMRGIGRMRDIGLAPAWGPGRHGPGANIFGYFVAPFGAVIEYSTAVEQVDDSYPTGTPEDWTWPENRIDHWGLSDKQSALLAEAERRFRFRDLPVDQGVAA